MFINPSHCCCTFQILYSTEFFGRLITIGDNCMGSPTIKHLVPSEQNAANVDKKAYDASSMIIKSKEGITKSGSLSKLKSLDRT